MPNTYTQLYVQIVFAVKDRQNFIRESFRDDLQKYITGITTNKKQKVYALYCMPDHTHLFISMQTDISVSDLVKNVKASSSSFLKEQRLVGPTFEWQTGFGGFSYSKSQASRVVQYILDQPAHHRKKTFRKEYFELLQKFEIEFDEKYLFEFYD